jgi:antitoxin HicB
MNLGFNLDIEPDENDTLFIVCHAIPPMVTFAETEGEVERWAIDAIETMLQSYMADGAPIPPGDLPVAGKTHVRLSLLATLKLQLYEACRLSGVSRAELARRLGWHREQVDRLFRLNHASRLDQVEAAFKAVGREIDLHVRTAA